MKLILIYISFLFIIYNCDGEQVVMDPDVENPEFYESIICSWLGMDFVCCTTRNNVDVTSVQVEGSVIWDRNIHGGNVIDFVIISSSFSNELVLAIIYVFRNEDVEKIYLQRNDDDDDNNGFFPITKSQFWRSIIDCARSAEDENEQYSELPYHMFLQDVYTKLTDPNYNPEVDSSDDDDEDDEDEEEEEEEEEEDDEDEEEEEEEEGNQQPPPQEDDDDNN